MIHPLFRLIATQPHLLGDHLEAYADLVGEEVGLAAAQLKRRMLWQSIAAGVNGGGEVRYAGNPQLTTAIDGGGTVRPGD